MRPIRIGDVDTREHGTPAWVNIGLKVGLYAGLGIGAYYGGKAILQHFGLLGTTDPQIAANAASTQQTITTLQNQGQSSTLTQAQATGIANTIFNAGTQSTPDSFTIRENLIQANTLLDLMNIKQAFGTRQADCTFLSFGCTSFDLDSFVSEKLNVDDRNIANQYFSDQGINYSIQ